MKRAMDGVMQVARVKPTNRRLPPSRCEGLTTGLSWPALVMLNSLVWYQAADVSSDAQETASILIEAPEKQFGALVVAVQVRSTEVGT